MSKGINEEMLCIIPDCLRAEIAAHNIHVMVSSPGYVATEVSRNALTGYGALHGGQFNFSSASFIPSTDFLFFKH